MYKYFSKDMYKNMFFFIIFQQFLMIMYVQKVFFSKRIHVQKFPYMYKFSKDVYKNVFFFLIFNNFNENICMKGFFFQKYMYKKFQIYNKSIL